MANNGNYRCKQVTIRKYDELAVLDYTHVYSMVDLGTTFTYDGAPVTNSQIADMIDGSIGDVGTWNDLVEEFRLWVEGQEALLDIQSVQSNVPYGVDLITCPYPYGDYF